MTISSDNNFLAGQNEVRIKSESETLHMYISLTNIYDLVSKFFDSFAEDTISGLGTKKIYDGKIKKIISKEKSKTYEELHSLVDANEDNSLVASSEFINFFKYYAKLIMECLLGYGSYDLTGKSISNRFKN